jgi:hypothetical protein
VAEALDRWRSCLVAAVPTLASATELGEPGDLRRLLDQGAVAGPIRQAATDGDASCRRDLDRTFRAALAEAEEAFVVRHAADLQSHRSQLIVDHLRLDLPVAPLE